MMGHQVTRFFFFFFDNPEESYELKLRQRQGSGGGRRWGSLERIWGNKIGLSAYESEGG